MITPVSFWRFDDDATDGVGSNNLTNVNSTAYATGKINNGADLESTSSNYFKIADASQSGLDITGDIAFSLWFKPESQVEGFLISKWGTAASNQRSYRLSYSTDAGGTIYFSVNPTGIDAATGEASWAVALSNGSWYHIVVSWVASTSTATLYVNNSSQGTDNTGTVTSIFNGDRDFNIGGDTNLGGYQDGIIDAVGVWNTTLSSTDVATLYNSGNGVQVPFVVAASAGSFTLTGVNTGVTVARKITAEVGTFILSGLSASFAISRWATTTKNSASFSNVSKNSISPNNTSKNSASWSNLSKTI